VRVVKGVVASFERVAVRFYESRLRVFRCFRDQYFSRDGRRRGFARAAPSQKSMLLLAKTTGVWYFLSWARGGSELRQWEELREACRPINPSMKRRTLQLAIDEPAALKIGRGRKEHTRKLNNKRDGRSDRMDD